MALALLLAPSVSDLLGSGTVYAAPLVAQSSAIEGREISSGAVEHRQPTMALSNTGPLNLSPIVSKVVEHDNLNPAPAPVRRTDYFAGQFVEVHNHGAWVSAKYVRSYTKTTKKGKKTISTVQHIVNQVHGMDSSSEVAFIDSMIRPATQ